jgi:hypothetical protein
VLVAAGKTIAVDLNCGVRKREITIEATKAINVPIRMIFLFFQMNTNRFWRSLSNSFTILDFSSAKIRFLCSSTIRF